MSTKIMPYEPFDTMENGALVLRIKASNTAGWSVVLAMKPTEFITWIVNDDSGGAMAGHYFPMVTKECAERANADFEERN